MGADLTDGFYARLLCVEVLVWYREFTERKIHAEGQLRGMGHSKEKNCLTPSPFLFLSPLHLTLRSFSVSTEH